MIATIMSWMRDFYYSNKNTCRFVGFNAKRKEAVFRLKMKSTVFKVALFEAVQNTQLIYALTAVEACWLGGYYGRYVRAVMDGRMIGAHDTSFLLSTKTHFQAQYHVISVDRHHVLTYFDYVNKTTHKTHVCEIAYHQDNISRFDNMQACYIGFLAGTIFEKQCDADKKWMRPLRLVERATLC